MEITAREIFLIKSKEWEYEQEWRILGFLEKGKGMSLNKEGEPIFDADGLPIYLFPIPPSCITGVIFGSRMTEANKKAISNCLSSNKRFSHVKKHQSVLDEKAFKLHTILSAVQYLIVSTLVE